ncbi:MAG: C39 family peptidase [Candidatus Berkelbacteria bacterium]|nr:C39 family peptidase [Candidatus Berkelbacteria bacterium]
MRLIRLIEKIAKIWFIVFGFLTIASVFLIAFYFQSQLKKSNIDIPAVSVDQTAVFNQASGSITTEKTPVAGEKATIPSKYLLKVAFQSQAPFGDWSEPYQNACEEASIITVEHYLKNQDLSKEQMKSEIDAAVAWQITNWGGHNDLNADQTLKLAADYFHLSGKVVRNYSLSDIQKYISSGIPVLAPTDGQMLGNPNFRGAGPEYHMIVIIGYDDSQSSEGDPLGGIFITNDVGTRKGEKYTYKYQTVLDAIFGPKKSMEKAIIVLSK